MRRGASSRHRPGEISVKLPGNVWHVAREYAGLAEAGGVKDVVLGTGRRPGPTRRFNHGRHTALRFPGASGGEEETGYLVHHVAAGPGQGKRAFRRARAGLPVGDAGREASSGRVAPLPSLAARRVYIHSPGRGGERMAKEGDWPLGFPSALNLLLQRAALEAAAGSWRSSGAVSLS